MRQIVNTMFISNNCPLFHLWWKENFAKHQKVSKYYETDCRSQDKGAVEKYNIWHHWNSSTVEEWYWNYTYKHIYHRQLEDSIKSAWHSVCIFNFIFWFHKSVNFNKSFDRRFLNLPLFYCPGKKTERTSEHANIT